jgi:hypothetical protein
MTRARKTRVGLALSLLGLGLQGWAALGWTPGTFVAAAAIGLPLVLGGVFVTWRSLGPDEEGPR